MYLGFYPFKIRTVDQECYPSDDIKLIESREDNIFPGWIKRNIGKGQKLSAKKLFRGVLGFIYQFGREISIIKSISLAPAEISNRTGLLLVRAG